MLPAILVLAQPTGWTPTQLQLLSMLKGIQGVSFRHDGETMVVKYRMIHVKERLKTKAKRTVMQMRVSEIPGPTGFKLETYEFPHSATERPRPFQAVLAGPEGRPEGAWRWDARDLQIAGANRARYYYLAWGSRADPKMLAVIRHTLEVGTQSAAIK